MKRSPLISIGSLNRTVQAAEDAWKDHNFPEAIEMMERAHRLVPSNVVILLSLGRMHGMRHNYSTAERCFEQAVRVAPLKFAVLSAAGQQCRSFNNLTLAENYLQRALEQKEASPAMFVQLAEVYERLRRPEAAAGLIDRVLHTDPACAPALLVRARLNRQAGRLDEAERQLRAFPASNNPHLQAGAAYELGSILDRQGHYDEAMTAFLEAKTILKPDATLFVVALQNSHQRLKLMAESFKPEIFQHWFETGLDLQPPQRLALLGGHPRSGTTLLEQVLDSHPDVVSAEETEIINDEVYPMLTRHHPKDSSMLPMLEAASANTLRAARATYLHSTELFLGQPVNGRLLVDKNPSLTILIPALIRIFPEIKFLIALRDPRDVVLSCFMQNLPLHQASAAWLTLADATAGYNAVMTVWQTVKARMRNPFLEVRYEDMVADLESVARRTLEFLDVPWDAKVLGFDEHARQKTVRSPTYADVTQPVYKRAVGRWRNYQKYLEPHLEKLEPFVKAFGYE